ncbi:MAG TPA: CBS domain-containing protein [Porticoccus sp.]|nr:CBS domain-containing protein [Porticoccus sp.]
MFYIIEQGSRIKTPVDRLFVPRGVPEVAASPAVSAVSSGSVDQSESKSQSIKNNVYTDASDDEPERSRVIYSHQIMSSPVVTASVDQTLEEIWVLFSKSRFHHLPILNNQQQLQGIVSDRDILRFAANKQRDVGGYRIEQLMTKRVISAAEETEVRLIAEVMCRQAIGAVPITDDSAALVGIVSRSDILRTLVNRAPLELWA